MSIKQYLLLIITFARVDVASQFQRSRFGTIWLLVNNCLYIGSLGFVWAYIFSVKAAEYFPFFSISYFLWVHISSSILESSMLNVTYSNIIKNLAIKSSFYVDRTVLKTIILLIYAIPVVSFIFIYFSVAPSLKSLMYFIGAFIVSMFVLREICNLIFVLSTYLPDFAKILPSIIQIVFLASPILWQPTMLVERSFIYEFNPVFYWLENLRNSLLYEQYNWNTSLSMAIFVLVASLIRVKILKRYFQNIPVLS